MVKKIIIIIITIIVTVTYDCESIEIKMANLSGMCFFFPVWFLGWFMAILCMLIQLVCSLNNPIKTHKMAINRLGNHRGKKKHTN